MNTIFLKKNILKFKQNIKKLKSYRSWKLKDFNFFSLAKKFLSKRVKLLKV